MAKEYQALFESQRSKFSEFASRARDHFLTEKFVFPDSALAAIKLGRELEQLVIETVKHIPEVGAEDKAAIYKIVREEFGRLNFPIRDEAKAYRACVVMLSGATEDPERPGVAVAAQNDAKIMQDFLSCFTDTYAEKEKVETSFQTKLDAIEVREKATTPAGYFHAERSALTKEFKAAAKDLDDPPPRFIPPKVKDGVDGNPLLLITLAERNLIAVYKELESAELSPKIQEIKNQLETSGGISEKQRDELSDVISNDSFDAMKDVITEFAATEEAAAHAQELESQRVEVEKKKAEEIAPELRDVAIAFAKNRDINAGDIYTEMIAFKQAIVDHIKSKISEPDISENAAAKLAHDVANSNEVLAVVAARCANNFYAQETMSFQDRKRATIDATQQYYVGEEKGPGFAPVANIATKVFYTDAITRANNVSVVEVSRADDTPSKILRNPMPVTEQTIRVQRHELANDEKGIVVVKSTTAPVKIPAPYSEKKFIKDALTSLVQNNVTAADVTPTFSGLGKLPDEKNKNLSDAYLQTKSDCGSYCKNQVQAEKLLEAKYKEIQAVSVAAKPNATVEEKLLAVQAKLDYREALYTVRKENGYNKAGFFHSFGASVGEKLEALKQMQAHVNEMLEDVRENKVSIGILLTEWPTSDAAKKGDLGVIHKEITGLKNIHQDSISRAFERAIPK